MYFERWPIYESAVGRSARLIEIIPETVTIRAEPRFYWHRIPAWVNDLPAHWTVFEEVSIVDPEKVWSPEVTAFVEECRGVERVQISWVDFVQICLQGLADAIKRAWWPGEAHLVLHSAGWDSRLMSLAIRALGESLGEDWLGDVLFLECANEAAEFKQIMQLGGWDESQYVVYNEGAPPDEYHARSLNFETAWERMDGGMRAYPFNMFWDTVEWAQEEGLVPDDVQCWSGFAANHMVKSVVAASETMAEELCAVSRLAVSAIPLRGEWVFPYTDLDFMRTLVRFGKGQRAWEVTEDVAISLEPGYAKIENPVFVLYRSLSNRLIKQAALDYASSWYGQLMPLAMGDAYHVPGHALDFNKGWGHWGLASLCEQLRIRGHTLKWEEEPVIVEEPVIITELIVVEEPIVVEESVIIEEPVEIVLPSPRRGRSRPRRRGHPQNRLAALKKD